MRPFFLILVFAEFILHAWAAGAALPVCDSPRYRQALSAAPLKAYGFCTKFTKQQVHTAYPSFLFKKCTTTKQPASKLDSALSAACTGFFKGINKPTGIKTTKAGPRTTAPPKTTGSKPTAPKTSGRRTTSPSKPKSSSKKGTKPTSRSTSSKKLAPAPTATLIPVLNINNNASDLKNLVPQDSSALYYAERSYLTNPYLVKLFAEMEVNFTYPTVLVENSKFLTNLECSTTMKADNLAGTLEFSVTSRDAFRIVKNTWTDLKNLVIVFNGDDCEKTTNNTRSYWLGYADTINWIDSSNAGYIRFVGDEILLQQGIANASLVWGTYGMTNSTGVKPTGLNNTALCGKNFNADAIKSAVPAINPCKGSFDDALDERIGYSYHPSLKRQADTKSLLFNAFSHPNIVVRFAANKKTTAKRSVKGHHLDRRGIGDFFNDVGNAFEEAGDGIVSVANVVTSAVTSAASEVGDAATKAASEVASKVTDAVNAVETIANKVADKLVGVAEEVKHELEGISNEIVVGVKEFGDDVVKAAEKVGEVAVNTVEEVEDLINNFEPSASGTMNVNLAPTKLEDSPWGEAYVLYRYPSNKGSRSEDLEARQLSKKVTAYCVDCGVHATAKYYGSAKFSIADGVTKMEFGLDGALDFGINIGIDASAKYDMPQQKFNLIPPKGIPYFEIPGIFVAGPVLSLAVTLDAEIHAYGRILAGASISIPNFSAKFDMVDTSNSYAKGFDKIDVKKYFAADGEIGASATLGLPFSIGVGIVIPPVKYDKQVKIVNTPALKAEAAFKGSISFGDGSPLPKTDPGYCPNGFSWALSFSNNLVLNVFDLYEYPIAGYNPPPFLQECYPIGGSSTSQFAALDGTSILAKNTTSTKAAPRPDAFVDRNYTSSASTTGKISDVVGKTYGVNLRDASGKLALVSALDGNLYMQKASGGATFFQLAKDASSLWVDDASKAAYVSSRALVTDDRDRGFFVFPASLAAFQVSRIRMASVDTIPDGASQTVLGYGDLDGSSVTPETFFFTDPAGPVSAFYPIGCVVTDAQNRNLTKVFAVASLDAGIAALNSNKPQIVGAVTGGLVRQCAFLGFAATTTPNPNPTDPVSIIMAQAKKLADLAKLNANNLIKDILDKFANAVKLGKLRR
ncbi:Hypothetical protein D9617_2g053540 [Elsinoe fawcettii]|nr:Hypothetical protein D9617_2g053540 [Elsinoe fawcettii]